MRDKQRGLTLISWILVLGVAFLFGVAALRLVPVYLEYLKISSSLTDVQHAFAGQAATPGDLAVAAADLVGAVEEEEADLGALDRLLGLPAEGHLQPHLSQNRADLAARSEVRMHDEEADVGERDLAFAGVVAVIGQFVLCTHVLWIRERLRIQLRRLRLRLGPPASGSRRCYRLHNAGLCLGSLCLHAHTLSP